MSELLFANAAPADLTSFTRLLAARMDQGDAFGPSLAQFLPNRIISGVQSRTTRVSRTQTVARVRAFDAVTPIGKRPVAIAQSKVGLAPLGQKLPIRETEIILQAIQSGDYNEVVNAIYDDFANNAGAIHNLIETFRAQFLSTGTVAINDNGFIQEADFGLPDNHNLALADIGTPWSTTTADVIEKELEWVNTTQQDADAPVVAQITSRRVVNAMLKADDYKVNGDGTVNYSITALNATRQAAGLPPVFIYEKSIAGERLIPDNLVILVTATVGETQWGDTAEALRLLGSNVLEDQGTEVPAIASSAWITEDPVNIWSKSNATALPVAGDINGLFVAEVLAESVESA